MCDVRRVLSLAPWLLAPVALPQGLRLRRTALRLPAAQGEVGEIGFSTPDAEPLRVVVVGDSVAAGVGLDHHEASMAGLVAQGLAERHGRPATWTVIGVSGATAGEATQLFAGRPELETADVVLISIGVNDTKNLHPARRWRRELGELLDAVLDAAPRADVLLFGIPPMDRLPALPRPLADFLGARSREFDRIGREVAALRPRIRRVEGELPPGRREWFASDGIHPSAVLHRQFADSVLGLLGAATNAPQL
jgi:lysophospholipase L1-like esterase